MRPCAYECYSIARRSLNIKIRSRHTDAAAHALSDQSPARSRLPLASAPAMYWQGPVARMRHAAQPAHGRGLKDIQAARQGVRGGISTSHTRLRSGQRERCFVLLGLMSDATKCNRTAADTVMQHHNVICGAAQQAMHTCIAPDTSHGWLETSMSSFICSPKRLAAKAYAAAKGFHVCRR